MEEKDYNSELHLGLIHAVIKKHFYKSLQFPWIELDDLIQEGYLGVLRAQEKYDISKGYTFSTYAFMWIWSYIHRWILYRCATIAIPCGIAESKKRYSIEEHDLPKVTRSLDAVPFDFEAIISAKNDFTKDFSVIDHMLAMEKSDFVVRIVKSLPEPDSIMLLMRYGLGEFRSHTLAEIGSIFNFTGEGIRIRINRNIRKLASSDELKELW